ncbi:MAG: hypothetical protein RLZZ565_1628 [Planctomycetota bacterium]
MVCVVFAMWRHVGARRAAGTLPLVRRQANVDRSCGATGRAGRRVAEPAPSGEVRMRSAGGGGAGKAPRGAASPRSWSRRSGGSRGGSHARSTASEMAPRDRCGRRDCGSHGPLARLADDSSASPPRGTPSFRPVETGEDSPPSGDPSRLASNGSCRASGAPGRRCSHHRNDDPRGLPATALTRRRRDRGGRGGRDSCRRPECGSQNVDLTP